MCNYANHDISGEIFGKLCRFPRSEIFYPTLEKAVDKEEVGLPVNISAKVKTSAGAQLVPADIFPY
jgi:hypothetical protein